MNDYNIVSALFEKAKAQPDVLAIAFPKKNSIDKSGITQYKKISFKELAHETACMARGLLDSGFKKGDKVLMMVPPGFDFFILGFAMLQSGIVPVFIDPGTGLKNLKKCINEVEPDGFIGISKAHIARVLFGWGKNSIQKILTIGPRLFWGGKKLETIRKIDGSETTASIFQAEPNDLAAVLFTTGSTGLPKGVYYTHGNFKAQLEMIRETFGFSPGEIDMPTFPPFALFNPALGVSSIIPDMDPTKPASVNPRHIIGPIKQFGITNMFGSPALLEKVGRYGEEHGVKLPSLTRVISAGAPASTKALVRFSTMLNTDAEIFTPYGSTEAMPITKIGSHQILRETQTKTENGHGVCIGKSIKGVQVDIIKIMDEAIPTWSENLKAAPGQVGEIVVKGPNVTQSYYKRESATKLAKIQDGNEVRHRMGDLGYQDAEGNFWFCGRKSHRVKSGNQEMYSIQCEHIFNKHPDVYRTALVGVDGEAILCVEMEKGNTHIDREKLKKELLSWANEHPLTKPIKTLLFHPSFPVDYRHNAKIIREQLADWAKKKLT
ncbi:fatty acid CoA ligase family protein [Shivajiella indica]|uniref:Fatty acid CoA ligase family protein n=1 Tax=Shivajiella indica TaxID=872115 RepID=A0ABW5B8F2_9BACT